MASWWRMCAYTINANPPGLYVTRKPESVLQHEQLRSAPINRNIIIIMWLKR